MPITADRIGESQPDEAGATAGEAAVNVNVMPVVAADADGISEGGPLAGRLGIARRVRAGQDAATTVEYALMLLLVSALCLAMTSMATSLTGALGRAAHALR